MKPLTLLATAALALAALITAAQQPAADPWAALSQYTFGKSREPLAAVEEQIRRTPPGGYAALEAKLLPLLQAAETPKDAKRFLCRWLGVVGSTNNSVPALAALLADDDLSHPARMALEPMTAPAAGAALREALPRAKGRVLAGLIGSIGARRDAEALPALTPLAAHEDLTVAAAALAALGRIGTEPAAQALAGLAVREALARDRERARLTAAALLGREGHQAAAATVYRALMASSQPKAIRGAALQGLIEVLPQAEAVALLTETLQGEDAVLRTAALSAFVVSPNTALKNALAAALPGMKPAGQRILLGALADQPEVTARPALLSLASATGESAVRAAAFECLARHGRAEDVPLLVRAAATQAEPEAAAARRTLTRMGQPGVDDALVRLIESAEAPERAAVLAILAARRATAALPALARLAGGPDPALAAEAARALGVMGGTNEIPALMAALVSTDNSAWRNACEDAARAICHRAPEKAPAARAILSALERATQPPARAALVRLLGDTGGPAPLAAVLQTLNDPSGEVRQAAFRTLVSWPDTTAAPHLLDLARNAPDSREAIVALREGCLRMAAMEGVPSAERLNLYRSVLETARRPEEKRLAISGLADLLTFASLDLLLAYGKDAVLKNEAIPAAIRVAREMGAVNSQRAVAALEQLKSMADNDALRQKAEDALKVARNAGQGPDGTILAWLLAGPYTQEGKTGADLFDIAFAPETPGAKAEWRPVPRPPANGLVEMNKILRGNDRVAYLRTQLTAERPQAILLEIGSDDGVKVWLNGKVIHANNATRPCSPGQDKVKAQLDQGVNTLLLKVTQGGGEWAACCRLRAPDGQPLNGVTVAAGEP